MNQMDSNLTYKTLEAQQFMSKLEGEEKLVVAENDELEFCV